MKTDRLRRAAPLVCVAALLAACASPALTLYTLAPPASATQEAPAGQPDAVIELARIALPDYLDTQDILLRRGNTLDRSKLGRWASRLSLVATDRVAQQLAERYPHALITDQPQTEIPTERVVINISRLDLTADGAGTLDADWSIVPRNSVIPIRRDRIHLALTGSVATDQDVVSLQGQMLEQLANAITLDAR